MKYKTFYKKKYELFGVFELVASEDSKELFAFVSTMPKLYLKDTTLEKLSSYYNSLGINKQFEDLVKEHDFELIEVELKII